MPTLCRWNDAARTDTLYIMDVVGESGHASNAMTCRHFLTAHSSEAQVRQRRRLETIARVVTVTPHSRGEVVVVGKKGKVPLSLSISRRR